MLQECPDTIDHISGSILDVCDRKYYWFMIRGIRPVAPNADIIANNAWRNALKEINWNTRDLILQISRASSYFPRHY
jgi:hypothetical protein